MANYRRLCKGWYPRPQRDDGGADPIVLPIGKRRGLIAFQFEPHRVIVAVRLALEGGFSRMPGAIRKAHELHQFAVAPHHKVCGNPQPGQAAEAGVGRRVQPAVEQILYRLAAELARRQGYGVQHDQAGIAPGRPLVAVWTRGLSGALHQTGIGVQDQHEGIAIAVRRPLTMLSQVLPPLFPAMKTRTLGVVMDPIATISPQKDSTLALLRAARRRGVALFHLTLGDIDIRDGRAFGQAAPLVVTTDDADWFRLESPQDLPLGELDLIFMRKDPPFNAEYIFATYVLQRAQAEGAIVVNDPQALRDINEKAFIAWFPDLAPPTIVTRSIVRMRHFLDTHGGIVVKPLDMMGGWSIFALDRTDKNLAVILETITAGETRFAMAQRYIPEVAAGDRRILLIDGRAVNPALNRVPRGDDNRGNLVAGARAEVCELTPRDIEICERVGAELAVRDVAFAGIDIIGDYLTEVNITSPTGIREIRNLSGVDAAALLIDSLLERLERSG